MASWNCHGLQLPTPGSPFAVVRLDEPDTDCCSWYPESHAVAHGILR